MLQIQFPITTGQVADLLQVPEYSLQNQIRNRKVMPQRSLGRRAWFAADVLKVARLLDKDSIEIRNALEAAVRLEASK